MDVSKMVAPTLRSEGALGLYLLYFPVVHPDTIPATGTTVPFFKYTLVVFAPWLYVGFVTFVVTGASNASVMASGFA